MLKRIVTMATVLLFAGPAVAQSNFRFFEPVQPPRAVQVMAHRGMQQYAPENSLDAVLGCASDYVEWAEIDVRLTKDGKHVVIHNDTIDATTNGRGRVEAFTLDELQAFDAGSWFAPRFRGRKLQSLAEVLEAAKGKVNLYLDCKRVEPKLLVDEIRAAGMESQVVVYDSAMVLKAIRTAGGDRIATMTKYRPKTMPLDAFLANVAPAAVEIDADEVTAELCKQFHAKGVKVQAKVLGKDWDNPKTWTAMMDAGVDWLQTDDPAGVRFTEVRRRVPKFPVKIAYHRGANRYAPENTLASIRTAVAWGADFVEIDIRTTSDGHHVLLHDRTLNRTTVGKGNIDEQLFQDVTSLDAGSWFGKPFADEKVPTFDDGLVALGEHSHVYLDAKAIAPEDLLAAIRKHRLMERHVVYQSVGYCEKLQALDPAVRSLPPLKTLAAFDSVAAIKPYGVDANWTILSKEMIEKCHAAGIRVFSDALGFHESVVEYRKAIDWGIDVIQTDHPLRVLRAIELTASRSR